MRDIKLIVIHCSATPNGVFVTPTQVDAWHAARGFKREAAAAKFNEPLKAIGYHYLISTDGRAYSGRHLDEVGAHVEGHNANSIGICLAGTDRFYMRQWQTLADTLCRLAYMLQQDRLVPAERVPYPLRPALAMAQLAKMGIRVCGHRDLSPDANGDGKITSTDWTKTCPGFDAASYLNAAMLPLAEAILDNYPPIAAPTAVERRKAA